MTSPIKTKRRTNDEMNAVKTAIYDMLSVENPMTLRQLFYRLVSDGTIGKKETEYKSLADITGKKLCLIEKEDASSLGAAMLAMKQLKLIRNYKDLKPETQFTIKPDKKHNTIYTANFVIYETLYDSLKDKMHQE